MWGVDNMSLGDLYIARKIVEEDIQRVREMEPFDYDGGQEDYYKLSEKLGRINDAIDGYMDNL